MAEAKKNGSNQGLATTQRRRAPLKAKKPPGKLSQTKKDAIARKERQAKTFKLRLRGYTYAQIAAELKVCEMTVMTDLKEVRKNATTRVTDFDQDIYVANELAEYDDLVNHGWIEYHQGVNVHQRVKALDFIRMTKRDRFDVVKNSGLIRTEPIQVNHNISGAVLHGWTDDVKAAAVKALLEGGLTSNLAEPVPDESIIDVEVIESESNSEDESG